MLVSKCSAWSTPALCALRSWHWLKIQAICRRHCRAAARHEFAPPEGRDTVNASAPPACHAGVGDVLVGLIAGLPAQGMSAWEETEAAAGLDRQAAAIAGPGLLAEGIPSAHPAVFAEAAAKRV